MLATHMHAQPGVYALLLGSGVSTGAGMPTGWGVVTQLIRRVAAAADPKNEEAGDEAAKDPEKWWADNHDTDLGYSGLLETLGATPAVRQNLLEGFFEPNADERAEDIKVPSKAHRAVAELVKRGYVKVILTTNFDRLVEQALDEVGVAAQVISSPDEVHGMKPLAHAKATVIKIHGDYLDLGTRNTVEELSDYPSEWKDLLRQVFDDYGLVISGWSGEWDKALVHTLQSSPNRRYPLYWDQRSSKGKAAQQILANRGGQTIDRPSADDMFADLLASLDALERLAAPPLTTAMAIARLKQYLPDPVRHIDLYDLVIGAADDLAARIAQQPVYIPGLTADQMQPMWQQCLADTSQLASLVTVGVWHDLNGTHDQLWIDALTRLVNASRDTQTTTQELLTNARLWPALLLFASTGIAATARRRDSLLIKMSITAQRERLNTRRPAAAELLHPEYLIPENVNPPAKGKRWRYPASYHLRIGLRHVFDGLIPDEDEFARAFHGWEYRLSLVLSRLGQHGRTARLYSGEYLQPFEWAGREPPVTQTEFSESAASDPQTTWSEYLGTDSLDEYLAEHAQNLGPYINRAI